MYTTLIRLIYITYQIIKAYSIKLLFFVYRMPLMDMTLELGMVITTIQKGLNNKCFMISLVNFVYESVLFWAIQRVDGCFTSPYAYHMVFPHSWWDFILLAVQFEYRTVKCPTRENIIPDHTIDAHLLS